jgi:predicted nucleic acid-binding protein
MEKYISGSNIFDLTDEIVNFVIGIRKSKRIHLPDAIIAATSLARDFTLITRNISDFKGIEGLKIIDLNGL